MPQGVKTNMTDSAIVYYHDKAAGLLKKTQDGYGR